MKFHKAKKVVIVIEAVVLNKVTKMITELGAEGYTVHAASGSGQRGIRVEYESDGLFKNVRIDAITSENVARKIAAEVLERFFDNYAGIVYLEDVEVIRAKKFHIDSSP